MNRGVNNKPKFITREKQGFFRRKSEKEQCEAVIGNDTSSADKKICRRGLIAPSAIGLCLLLALAVC
jgi:hypothetical protein